MRCMHAKRITPILNVSNIVESFAWFEKLGWTKGWDWGTPLDDVDAIHRQCVAQGIEITISQGLEGAE
jgi:hypothetical protein